MARKRKSARPADPAQIARRRAAERARDRDPATWGLNAEALDLPVNVEVETRGDPTRTAPRAKRQDVFDILHTRGRLSNPALNAVRRLQDDIARLHRTATGGGDFSPRVDSTRIPDGFSDARARAGARIEAALALAGAASARLIGALCEDEVVLGRAADWRAVVQRQCGERLPDAQSAVLRAACENLAGAYATIDRAAPRAALPRGRPGG